MRSRMVRRSVAVCIMTVIVFSAFAVRALPTAHAACSDADVDHSGKVSLADAILVAGHFQQPAGVGSGNEVYDPLHNGYVTILDLAYVLSYYNQVC